MYRKLICLICLMAVFAFVGTAQAALLQNGGFEDPVAFNHWELYPGSGVTGVWSWGNGTVAINTTDAYEGLACADVNVIMGGAGVCQGVFIGAGVPVSMSAYVKTVRCTGLAGGGIDMVFFPSEEEQCQCLPNISRVDLHFDGSVTQTGFTLPYSGHWNTIDTNGWKYGILNTTTPPGTALVKFEIHANNNPGEFLFDNVVGSGFREADLNEDYRVDFRDFAILGNQWFQAPGYPSADISPPGGDGIVNFEDLALLADQWLEE